MTISPETLLAFIDGELTPEEARRVAAEVASDPQLAAHVEKHKALRARLQATSTPVPEASRDSGEAPAPAAPPPAGKPGGPLLQFGRSWIPAGAMAIGILLGLLLAISLRPGSEIRSQGGTAVAQGALARALSQTIGVEQTGDVPEAAHIEDTFFSNEGYFCRVFTASGEAEGALAGIACREGADWRIELLAANRPGEGEQTAALPAAVSAALNTMMVGAPLDADGERAARSQDWLVH